VPSFFLVTFLCLIGLSKQVVMMVVVVVVVVVVVQEAKGVQQEDSGCRSGGSRCEA
jgi:hypothetical protein